MRCRAAPGWWWRCHLGPCPWGRSTVLDGKEKSTRKGNTAPGHQRGGEAPRSCSLLPTTPLSRETPATHAGSRISNSASLQLSPAFFLAPGSAGATPPALFTGAKSTLLAAGGVSLHRPAPALCPRLCRGHRGHRSRLLLGYIHKTSPCRGLGWGIRLRSGEQLSLLTPHPALGSSSDKPQPGLAAVIVPSRP